MTREQADEIRYLAAMYATNCVIAENLFETYADRALSREQGAAAWQSLVDLLESLVTKD